MRKAIGILVLCTLGWTADAAEDVPACDEAAYTPGVDVNGKPVTPADATPTVTAQIDPFVIVQQTPRGNGHNRGAAQDAQTGVYLEGLDRALNPSPCPPRIPASPRPRSPGTEGREADT